MEENKTKTPPQDLGQMFGNMVSSFGQNAGKASIGLGEAFNAGLLSGVPAAAETAKASIAMSAPAQAGKILGAASTYTPGQEGEMGRISQEIGNQLSPQKMWEDYKVGLSASLKKNAGNIPPMQVGEQIKQLGQFEQEAGLVTTQPQTQSNQPITVQPTTNNAPQAQVSSGIGNNLGEAKKLSQDADNGTVKKGESFWENLGLRLMAGGAGLQGKDPSAVIANYRGIQSDSLKAQASLIDAQEKLKKTEMGDFKPEEIAKQHTDALKEYGNARRQKKIIDNAFRLKTASADYLALNNAMKLAGKDISLRSSNVDEFIKTFGLKEKYRESLVKLSKNVRLTDEQRGEVQNAVNTVMNGLDTNAKNIDESHRALIKRRGLNPDDYLVNPFYESEGSTPSGTSFKRIQ